MLTSFAAQIFVAAGVDAREASVVAGSLVASNLRGHDSHGVMRVAEYVGYLRTGELVAGADLNVVAETGSLLVADAQLGFGQVQMARLIERLAPKARQQGLASGTLRNCGHVGRLGEWVERAAREGFAAFLTVNDNGVVTCVAPPGGTEPRISTNPLAIGVPTGGEPLVLDMSTSVVANGKVQVARLAGRPCPPGWLLDADGQPTTDPEVRFADPPGTLLPLGGEQSYKGFSLGLLLDILAGGLSGGFCPPAPESAPSANNVLLVLWDADRFSGLSHFRGEADKLIAACRNVRLRAGADGIRLPGDRGLDVLRERTEQGIPLDTGTWNSLTRLASERGVCIPPTRRQSVAGT